MEPQRELQETQAEGDIMSKLQKSILLATTALSLTGPVAVYAQSSAVAAGQEQIEQVVVTARRREERLQDVPISITVFNQQQLQNHNVVNAVDLVKYTPSLSANSNFGSQNTTFAIRGFAQDIGTAPSVGVFFADVVEPHSPTQGIQAGDGAGPGEFFDLQNVQVLKGPQGTLFGRNTTGGDVLIVPQKPTDEFGGYVQGSFGNYDMRGGQGVINIPVNDDIRIRLGIDHESRDGYLINNSGVGPKDFDDVNYTALRGSIDIDLTPDLENYTIASYSVSDTNGDYQKLVASTTAFSGLGLLAGSELKPGKLISQGGSSQGTGFYDSTQGMSDPYSDLTQWRVINSTTWRESDNVTIKNIASYSQISYNVANPLFGVVINAAPFYPSVPKSLLPLFGFATVSSPPGVPFADQGNYTEELQLQGNALDNRFTYQAGGYLQGDVPLALTGAQSAVTASCTNIGAYLCYDPLGGLADIHHGADNLTLGKTWDSDYAIYTQDSYALTDELKLTGGFRYTWDREANTSTQIVDMLNYPFSNGTSGVPLPQGVAGRYCANPTATGPTTPAAGLLNGAAPLPSGDCTLHFYERSSAPTWLIDLDYKPTDDILGYIKWARGYRQGIISTNITPPYNVVNPETVDDYEAGVKTSFDFAGIAGTFDVNGFYNKFRNQQLLIGFNAAPGATVSPTAAPVNAGKSRLDGVELDTSIVPYDGVTLTVGYTYLDTEILSVKNIVAPPGGLYVKSSSIAPGDPVELSPNNKVTFTAAYVLPLDDSIGKITVSSTFTHTDSQITNYGDCTVQSYAADGITSVPKAFANLCSIQATNLLDLNLNWEQVMGKPLDLSVFATNVTGDKYYTWLPGLAPAAGIETADIGEPTFYGVRVTIHFGEQ
jgi:iron complex outermembrane recepter protein